MRSDAATIDQYVDELPEGRREWVGQIRDDCRELLTGLTEEMAYGMPSFRRPGGEIALAFASQKQYVAVYFPTGVMAPYRDRLPDCGKGCLRYRRREAMDRDLLREMLAAIG